MGQDRIGKEMAMGQLGCLAMDDHKVGTEREVISECGFEYAVPSVPSRNMTLYMIGQMLQLKTMTASQERPDIALDRFDSFDVGADMLECWSARDWPGGLRTGATSMKR
ncbi:hypothetical protein FKW77_003340 [Venturia effusa]|uniref:Uncharacterized protein n=1 Tax=Venturia effusa TaxID=50376 RepID=A0A517L107_9PEZI|nr:hypothetical protein FKW77_003340 [Venturia effusa]